MNVGIFQLNARLHASTRRAVGLGAVTVAVLLPAQVPVQGAGTETCRCPGSTIERRTLAAADVSAWSLGNGEMPRLSATNGALRIDFTDGRACWANLRHAVSLPSNAVAFVWQEKALKPSVGSRTMWLREADGDAWFVELPRVRDALGVWREVVVELGTFAFHKEGNGCREMDTVNRFDMGFNNGDQSVLIRDLQIVLRNEGSEAAYTCAAARAALDPSARIAVLDCGPHASHVRRVLNAAGLAARRVTPCELVLLKGVRPQW